MENLPSEALSNASEIEIANYNKIAHMLEIAQIPKNAILANLGLFLTRSTLSRILFLARMYHEQLTVPGIVMEFGCRWGHNLALMATLRNIFEPHNYWRKIVGFDTFAGFPSVSAAHDRDRWAIPGHLSVSENYETFLNDLLVCHEALSPRSHLRRFELIKGDVVTTVPTYFTEHPDTIVSLAYFDLDLYEPTKAALEAVIPRLVKGSVLVFDELCIGEYPGETVAVIESLGLGKLRLLRDPASVAVSYAIFGD